MTMTRLAKDNRLLAFEAERPDMPYRLAAHPHA
jgi:hypothetical protein